MEIKEINSSFREAEGAVIVIDSFLYDNVCMSRIKKYLIPHEENDYAPHIFREASVALMSFLIILVFFTGVAHYVLLFKTDMLANILPGVLVDLANTDRSTYKLNGLTVNPLLEKAAKMKAEDMLKKGYFAHVSPEGVEPWKWIEEAGYQFTYAGENLAINFSDSEDVDRAWMNSPGHRANILNSHFTEIGVASVTGIYEGQETVFVVQMFGSPRPIPKKKPKVTSVFINTKNSTSTSLTASSSPKISTTTIGAQKTETKSSSSTVLGAEGQYINFVSVAEIGPEEASQIKNASSQNSVAPKYSTFSEKMFTSPRKIMRFAYLFLGVFILLALIFLIVIEFRRQHPRYIILACTLLILIVLFFSIYAKMFLPEIMIV